MTTVFWGYDEITSCDVYLSGSSDQYDKIKSAVQRGEAYFNLTDSNGNPVDMHSVSADMAIEGNHFHFTLRSEIYAIDSLDFTQTKITEGNVTFHSEDGNITIEF